MRLDISACVAEPLCPQPALGRGHVSLGETQALFPVKNTLG